MKILIAGATGFTGKRVLPKIAGRAEVRIFARADSDISLAKKLGMEVAVGEWDDADSLERALQGIDAMIHIGSLGFGHAPKIVQALEKAKVKRALFISTTAIFTRLPAPSKKMRLAAEATVTSSSLQWTILRPTMIYGGADDRNMIRLLKFLRLFPLVLIPGDGQSLQRPIHVEDLAQAIVDAFFNPQTIGKSYNLSGASPLSFNQVIDASAKALGKKRCKLHLPLSLILPFVRGVEKLAVHLKKKPLIKEEQVMRLLEDKSFDFTEAARDFAFRPRPFEQGIAQEAQSVWPHLKGKE